MDRPAHLLVVATLAAGCLSTPSLSAEALMDPAYCESCHPDHYREWASSTHAYASDSPIFLATNARGQRETGGALGDFCVSCHAPMAVRTGATTDGLNLASLPRSLRGVTCYFCHSVEAVEGTHNNPLRLADDGVMRGGHRDPLPTPAHRSAYSELLDGRRLESSALCGACHDVVTPSGLHLERTYAEWQASLFAQPGPAALSCNRCHMPGRDGPGAAVPGAPARRLHEHAWPGVTVALVPWPDTELQRRLIERDLGPSVETVLCVEPGPGGLEVTVTLDNVFAGHSWPSGVTHARRAWVELVAWEGDEPVLASGMVAPDEALVDLEDPSLWLLHSRLFGADGEEVHTAWEAVTMESELLSAAVTADPLDPRFYHASSRTYRLGDLSPDRITVALHMRPVGLEMIDELAKTGDLAPAEAARLHAAVPTFTLAPSRLEWRVEDGFGCL